MEVFIAHNLTFKCPLMLFSDVFCELSDAIFNKNYCLNKNVSSLEAELLFLERN